MIDSFIYNTNDQLVKLQSILGLKSGFINRLPSNLFKTLKSTRSVGRSLTYEYNESGQLTSISSEVDASGSFYYAIYEYDISGNIVSELLYADVVDVTDLPDVENEVYFEYDSKNAAAKHVFVPYMISTKVNNPLKFTTIDHDYYGTTTSETTYEYTYNENDYPVNYLEVTTSDSDDSSAQESSGTMTYIQ